MLLCLSATALWAQEAEPTPEPGGSEQVDQARSILPRVGTDETPVMPTVPPESSPLQPGITEGQDWLKVLHETLETDISTSTLAEGAFVMGRVGDLVMAPNNLLIFVPDKQTRQPGEGPVLILPSRTLENLRDEWSDQRVLISGEIFSYHQRNHLLLSDYRLVVEQPAEPTEQQEPGTGDSEDPRQPIEADPDVRDLLDELDQDLPRDPNASSAATPGADSISTLPRRQVTSNESAQSGPEEGTLIVRTPARMVRNAKGAWTLVFDNDSPEIGSDDRLIVMPCRALMKMEFSAMQRGDAAKFLVSGRVYTFLGDSYILPSLVQRLDPSEINSLQ